MRILSFKAENFKRLSSVDFAELDAERKTLFEERTNVNRDGKAKRAEVDAIVFDKDAPDEVVSVSDLVSEIERLNHFIEIAGGIR